MIFRVTSVWIAVVSCSIVSIICYALASSIGFSEHGPYELPFISKFFFPDAIVAYLYPVPLIILALLHTVYSREVGEHSQMLVALTLSSCLVFLSTFLLAIALPFTPKSATYIKGEQVGAPNPLPAK